MTLSTTKLILTAAAVAFTALATPAAAAQLSGQQFIDTHSGKCLSYSGPSVGTECYNADGTTQYQDQIYGTDTGTWMMRGNDVCVRYTAEPALDCGPVSQNSDGSFTDGVYTWTIN